MLNLEKLEKLLLTHWTEFIDARSLMASASQAIALFEEMEPCKIQKLTVSRFEFVEYGFLLWLECRIGEENFTVELFLGSTGSIQYQQCLKN